MGHGAQTSVTYDYNSTQQDKDRYKEELVKCKELFEKFKESVPCIPAFSDKVKDFEKLDDAIYDVEVFLDRL